MAQAVICRPPPPPPLLTTTTTTRGEMDPAAYQPANTAGVLTNAEQ